MKLELNLKKKTYFFQKKNFILLYFYIAESKHESI
jgi:hypothetical protein